MKKRALISVFDKENIVEFSKKLEKLGWEIISTGGTYKELKNSGINVIEVNEVTNFPEMLDGRVKTLHPLIHSGILYRRDVKEHVETMEEKGIASVDMVVNNLYPFEKTLRDTSKTHEDLIENIDIGGPSMIRAAAKNYKDVIVVVDTKDYDEIIEKLESNTLDLDYRLHLSGKAFNYTAYYDALISNYFNKKLNIEFPEKMTKTYRKVQELRYGENPHQRSSYYENVFEKECEFKQLHGKELSYNNFTDIYATVQMLKEFSEPCVVGVKHNSPSGIGIGKTIDEAFDKAYNCDRISIFGGIIAINDKVTEYIANILNSFFVEIVIAESFSEEALNILTQKKNIRLITIENIKEFNISKQQEKQVLNGIITQDYDDKFIDALEFVTTEKPNEEELEELLFAFRASKCVRSNGIVISKNKGTIGIGQGEVRRSWAAEEAINRAKEHGLENAVMASDAFFFEDTVELLNENGIKSVIQPGGSIKDPKVIELCNKYGIKLVLTNMRHFRH